MIDPAAARLAMVESQLRTNKVTDPAVLDAFLEIPRERFVPPSLAGAAYVDDNLPLGHGRFLVEPMVLARLIQLAQLSPTANVLEIAAGTGYATAILARLARSVVAVESVGAFVAAAAPRLAQLRCGNARVVEGPLAAGWPANAPYDAILINGATRAIPPELAGQLAEGGRLVAVLKEGAGMGQAILGTKIRGVFSHRSVFDAGTPVLPELERRPSFVF